MHQFSSVQLLSHVRLFATPWIAARQASLFITNSRCSVKIEILSFAIFPVLLAQQIFFLKSNCMPGIWLKVKSFQRQVNNLYEVPELPEPPVLGWEWGDSNAYYNLEPWFLSGEGKHIGCQWLAFVWLVMSDDFLEQVTSKLILKEWIVVNQNNASCHPTNAPFQHQQWHLICLCIYFGLTLPQLTSFSKTVLKWG